jgi:hypothetical protein
MCSLFNKKIIGFFINSNFGHTDFKVWSSLHACHFKGATYRNHCELDGGKENVLPIMELNPGDRSISSMNRH